MPFDSIEYLNKLDQERYRALIIHAEPSQAIDLEKFLKKFSSRMDGIYIDVLQQFIKNEVFSESVDKFTPERFREYLIDRSKGSKLLIVNNIDFIFDTWIKPVRTSAFSMLIDQWDSYKPNTRSKLILGMGTTHEIQRLQINGNFPKILKLTDLNDLM